MNSSLRCFLVVAETLNVTKSAKKLYLTQQCVSGHIKRLEMQYETLLFNRKPKLTLTSSGKALLKTVKEISIIENGLDKELRAISQGERGELKFGIHSGRSRIIMPDILSRFVPLFPDVKLFIEYGETKQLERMLLDGQIDMFFGINAERHSDYLYTHLMDEQLYLVVSDNLLCKYFGEKYKQEKHIYINGVDLNDYCNFPFIFTHKISRAQQIISAFLIENNIKLKQMITIRDHNLHIDLCANDIGVCICPRMMLWQADEWKNSKQTKTNINIFPIKGLTQTIRLELITHKHAYIPKYMHNFCDVFVEVITKYK